MLGGAGARDGACGARAVPGVGGRGEGEAGQRERGYKHGYGSWTRTVERVPRSRTRRTVEPNPGSNSWIELVDTQRSRRMVQDGDWNPSNPPRDGEWRSRAPASFAPQCSVRRPCHLVLSSSRSRSRCRLSHRIDSRRQMPGHTRVSAERESHPEAFGPTCGSSGGRALPRSETCAPRGVAGTSRNARAYFSLTSCKSSEPKESVGVRGSARARAPRLAARILTNHIHSCILIHGSSEDFAPIPWNTMKG